MIRPLPWRGYAVSLVIALVVLTAACRRVASDVVAVYDDGEIRIGEVEMELQTLPEAQRLRADVDLLDTYRQLARGMVLERILLDGRTTPRAAGRDLDELNTRLEELSSSDPRPILATLAELYAQRVLIPELGIEITDAEIERYYREHIGQFTQPESVLLSSILIRDSSSGGRRETDELLEQLRAALLAGEPFATVARTYSDSETAPLGGEVGWVERGVLPAALERVAFALRAGEVSEPLRDRSGGILLHVADRIDGAVFPRDQVASRIRARLLRERQAQAIEQWVKEREEPAGSIVLAGEELEELVLRILQQDESASADGSSPVVFAEDEVDEASAETADGSVVLRIGDFVVSSADLEQWIEAAKSRIEASRPSSEVRASEVRASEDRASEDRDSEGTDLQIVASVQPVYELARRRALLADAARADGFAERPEVTAQLVRVLEAQQRNGELAIALQREVQQEFEALETAAREGKGNLHRYFEENRDLFRSEVAFDLEALVVTGSSPLQQSRAADAAQRLGAGAIEVEAVARELGAEVRDLGELSFSQLPQVLDRKLIRHVVQLQGTGVTPPVRVAGDLWVVSVVARTEPQPQSYEQVEDRVIHRYRSTQRQQVLSEVTERLLAEANYQFYEERLRSVLGLDEIERGSPDAATSQEGA